MVKGQQKNKILAALSLIGDPYDSKRIKLLLEAGFEVEAVAFERKYHKGRGLDCEVVTLGTIEHGQYFLRCWKMAAALPVVRTILKKHEVVYASGLDMALLVLIAGIGLRKPIIVGIADIRAVQVAGGFSGKVMRWLEKQIMSRSRLLIITASGFFDGYYKEWLKVKIPTIVIENKLERDPKLRSGIQEPLVSPVLVLNKQLRIGYFGVLRCKWSFEVLLALAKAKPNDVEIILAGIPLIDEKFLTEVEKYPNVQYIGTYNSPEGLPTLYDKVDIVWACYPGPEIENPRWRWAQMICRSNRFYESCFFKKPIISLGESGDGIEVEKHQIGKVLIDQSTVAVIKELSTITSQDLYLWKMNLAKLPDHVYQYSTEVSDLKCAIHEILEKEKKIIC